MKRTLPALLFLLHFLPCSPHAQEPGIYADFSTSLGDFTARLDYERAPKAVAAFVGLATGEKVWLDAFGNVHASTPFYDGTIFHRVLPGLAVQGGGVADPCDAWLPSNGVGNVFGPIAIGPLELSIPPGGATNLVYEGSFAFTNGPAEPATIVRGGETEGIMQTNRSIHRLWTASSAVYGGETFVWTKEHFNFTNFNATAASTVTNCPFTLFLPFSNPTESNLSLTYSGEIRWSTTNTLYPHSVATNFSNAGFYYPDAFSNGLVHTAGALAMDHNAFANTDGSKFVVCATDIPERDGNYTVFGQVVSGLDVVQDLASVPVDTDNNNRPTNDLVLRSVTIRRIGTAARDFDIHAQRLPVVDNLPVTMVHSTNRVDISLTIPAQSEAMLRLTTNLLRTGWGAWDSGDSGYIPNATPSFFSLPSPPDRLFVHASAVTYPDAWTLPESFRGQTFDFVWNTDPPTRETLAFAKSESPLAVGTSTRTCGDHISTGLLYSLPVEWARQPYSAGLHYEDDYLPGKHTYMLRWNPGAPCGTATGIILPPGSNVASYVSGTFTVENTPDSQPTP